MNYFQYLDCLKSEFRLVKRNGITTETINN